MNCFYPGAEPECDGCPFQIAFEPESKLWCDQWPGVAAVYYYSKCMRERKESQDD